MHLQKGTLSNSFRRFALVCTTAVSGILYSCDYHILHERHSDKLFGVDMVSTPYDDHNFSDKESWDATMRRYGRDMADSAKAPRFREFLSRFGALKDKPLDTKIDEVNEAVNKLIEYDTLENGVWSKEIYSPVETALRGKGICRDYAILKYYVLRELGIPAEDLYLATVASEGTKRDHMVLAARSEDGCFLLLDNGHSYLVNSADSGYGFYTAFNEKGDYLLQEIDHRMGGTWIRYTDQAKSLNEVFLKAADPKLLHEAIDKLAETGFRGEQLIHAVTVKYPNLATEADVYKNGISAKDAAEIAKTVRKEMSPRYTDMY